MDKKASELLAEACLRVKQLEEDFERCLGYLHCLGIDPMDGGPNAEEIIGMQIQELKQINGVHIGNIDLLKKELHDLKQSLLRLGHETGN